MFLLAGHVGKVGANALAFSPDGSLLASGGGDGLVKLWGLAARAERAALGGHRQLVTGVSFLGGGEVLASGGWDGSVRFWDVARGKQLRRFQEEEGVNCLAVSADGRLVAAAGGEAVSLWDAKGYARLAPVGEHDIEIGAVALSPDGHWLASGAADRTTGLWELPSGREVARLKHPAWVQGLAFAPDGGTLAIAVGRRVVLWDVGKRRQRAALTGHRNTVLSVVFTPDGRALLSGSRDGSVRRWALAEGGPPATFRWKVGSVEAVACAPDGMTAAAGGDSGTLVVWDLED